MLWAGQHLMFSLGTFPPRYLEPPIGPASLSSIEFDLEYMMKPINAEQDGNQMANIFSLTIFP